MFGHRFLRFFDGLADHLDLAVGRPQIDHAAGIDRIRPRDRLIDQRIGDLHLEHIQGLDVIGSFGDKFDRINQQHVGRLDDVGGGRAGSFGQCCGGLGNRLIQVLAAPGRRSRRTGGALAGSVL